MADFVQHTVLVRKRVPLPQVLVQSLHGLQRDHFASEIVRKIARSLFFQCINISVLSTIEFAFQKCQTLLNIKPLNPFKGQPTFKQSQNNRTFIAVSIHV